jgi:hypothetical protein
MLEIYAVGGNIRRSAGRREFRTAGGQGCITRYRSPWAGIILKIKIERLWEKSFPRIFFYMVKKGNFEEYSLNLTFVKLNFPILINP